MGCARISKNSGRISFLRTRPKLLCPLHTQSHEHRSIKSEILYAKRHIFCVVKNPVNDFMVRDYIECISVSVCS